MWVNVKEEKLSASARELDRFVLDPREELSVEYKDWLDLTDNKHRATLAKAAIAIANHGGGFIVIGFAEVGQDLKSHNQPSDFPPVTQDAVNEAIRRYADPEFHCDTVTISHPVTGASHPVIVVDRDMNVPVMSKRDCPEVISARRCYIRKPGPRSEEPKSGEEWRRLLDRCVRARRDDMLAAIRSIVLGRVEPPESQSDTRSDLERYCAESHTRLKELLTKDHVSDSSARFPHGYYEMGFSLVDATSARNLSEVKDRLSTARRVKLTGWPPFLELVTQGRDPYAYRDHIEAWLGRRVTPDLGERSAAHCDFWRVSMDGRLYTIRGYQEDYLENIPVGMKFDVTLPIWRIGEGLLFASRFGDTFDQIDEIAIRCRYTGLNGRCLSSITRDLPFFGEECSRMDEITLQKQVTQDQIRDNLVEILHQLLEPLYECFSFYQLSRTLVEKELERLLRR